MATWYLNLLIRLHESNVTETKTKTRDFSLLPITPTPSLFCPASGPHSFNICCQVDSVTIRTQPTGPRLDPPLAQVAGVRTIYGDGIEEGEKTLNR